MVMTTETLKHVQIICTYFHLQHHWKHINTHNEADDEDDHHDDDENESNDEDDDNDGLILFGLLVFNGTFSTNRLYRAIGVWIIYCVGLGENIQQHKQAKRKKNTHNLFDLGST